jgi:hypothetical protein
MRRIRPSNIQASMNGFTVQETVEDCPWIGKISRHTSSAADPDSWKQSLQWCAAVRHLNVSYWPTTAASQRAGGDGPLWCAYLPKNRERPKGRSRPVADIPGLRGEV